MTLSSTPVQDAHLDEEKVTVTASKRLTTSALLNDATLEYKVIQVFESCGAQPKKDLGYEIRKRLPDKYRQPGDSRAVFNAIRTIVRRLEKSNVLMLNATRTHYMLAPQDDQQLRSTGAKPSQQNRKSPGRSAGRQNLVGASAH